MKIIFLDIDGVLNSFETFEEIYDITPDSKDGKRENEIREWLNQSSLDIESFVVIDDDVGDLDCFVNNELIKTSFIEIDENGNYNADKCGLTIVHVLEAIDKLNNSKSKVLLKS